MFERFSRGRSGQPIVVLPCYLSTQHFFPLVYLVHLIYQGSSVSLLNTVLCGTSWVHKKSVLLELGDHPLVRQVVEAGRRILARPPNRKKAFEVSQIRRIIQRLEQSHLADLQVAALFVFGFFGFLR